MSVGTLSAMQPCRDLFTNLVSMASGPLPRLDRADLAGNAGVGDLFLLMPRAHAEGRARYLNRSTNHLGETIAVIEGKLDAVGGRTPEGFRALFETGEYSFVVQDFETCAPWADRVAESLRKLTGGRVSATAFLTPAGSAATEPHYDKADVLALQFEGTKQWSAFPPVDPRPNFRTPDQAVGPMMSAPPTVYQLEAGSVLWMPRGWIHKVENTGAETSLHLSFVLFPDAWTSVFANLMDTAYSQLRDRPDWRDDLRPGNSPHPEVRSRIEAMCADLRNEMLDLATFGITHFVDHCPNAASQRASVRRGQDSIALLEGPAQTLYMRPSGATTLLRAGDTAGTVKLSTNGEAFHPVNFRLYRHLQGCGSTAVSELESGGFCLEQELLESIDALVRKLGLFEFSASAGP